VVRQMTHGHADIAGDKPIQMDTIMRVYSVKDTAFHVPKEKMSRLATIYSWSADKLTPMPHDPNVNAPPGLPSGGLRRDVVLDRSHQ
jgi:hypothetical protein